MLTVYSPVSSRVRLLSSKDAVDGKKVILPSYSGAIVSSELIMTTIVVDTLKLQLTDENGFSVGDSVVVKITVSPTAAFRPSGNTPAPSVKPAGEE